MPTLQICTVPPMFASSPALALRQVCTPVDIDSTEARRQALWVIQELFEVLYTVGSGVGLAAPQLGVLQRIFVVDSEQHPPLALVNPTISAHSAETESELESCLSIPGYMALVPRAKAARVRAISPSTWEPIEIEVEGFLARIVQHEADHLDGVLFLDHLEGLHKLEEQIPYGSKRALRSLDALNLKPTMLAL